ncbi:hypothetical protein HID58_008846 [Brassica napus]|uniref:(rape) hypothetical protein n=1 Tax=Brassica napus TaxID=3708 RepID=A0A816W1V5_BRANA|nr:uncharacterized protein LOC106433958 [Brassica napus]KAH0931729.1 hypothetical protein HID58_008846 [Brassica napus]CAF2120242.1 unnamed protein product [Brassica napus]
MDLTINAVTETWIKDTSSPKFWTTCPFCSVCYRLHRSFVSKQTRCRCCNKDFTARETPLQGLSSKDSTPKRILSQMLRETHQYHPVAPSSSGPSFWTTCRNCGCRHRFLRVYLDKWFVCPSCKEETIAMEVLSSSGEVRFSKWFQEFRSMCKNEAASVSGNKSSPGEKRKREEEVAALSQNHSKPDGVIGSGVDNNRRGFNGNGDEASSSGNAKVDNNFCLRDSSSGGGVQPKIAGLKFNDFGKLREEVNFAVGQVWALYDTTDKVPRQYALIRKVSVPSFGLRITYLEPDPDDEEEIQWFEEDLPVCTGQFRLGKNENTKDRSLFSHVIHCNEGGSNSGHFTVSPRKGETWALFKNWDINWSSEPDSHRSYEYEFVEILSDYTDGAGVYAAILHKAKGFASVFFPMGTGDADKFYILPHSLYRFYHRIPSFKLTGVDVKGLPKYAYELDQAALPATIEEVTVPSHLLAEFAPPKPEALCFPINGKVFKTGQIWSYIGSNDNMPRDYCRIHKISVTQTFEQAPVYKIVSYRLKAKRLPEEGIIPWEDKKLHVSCGTFLVSKVFAALAPNNFSHLMVPQASMEGNEYTYTILPKVGQVWAIYRFWNGFLEETYEDYVVVEVLDDALDYKVLALEPALQFIEEKEGKRVFGAAESRPRDYDDGDEVMFTIPKLKVLRFSHQIGASRVTKEIDGELKELFELDTAAVPVL